MDMCICAYNVYMCMFEFVCMCLCVCVYMCICVYMCVCVFIHVYVRGLYCQELEPFSLQFELFLYSLILVVTYHNSDAVMYSFISNVHNR